MSNLVSSFPFEASRVRVTPVDGEPWFVARDVADALGYKWQVNLIGHVPREWKDVKRINTPGGAQEMWVLSEQGIYFFVGRSDKPKALPFQKWLAGDVLPAIRRTGAYGVAASDPLAALNDPTQLRTLLLGYSEKVIALEARVEEQAPKVAALERIAVATQGSMSVREAAKTLQVQPKALTLWMQERRWIYRHPVGRTWLAYQPRLLSGLLEHKMVIGERTDGTEWGSTQVRVTAKGLARIAELLEQERKAA